MPVVVTYHTADGTAKAGADYTEASGHITIPVGQRSADIPVTTSTGLLSMGRTFSLVLDRAAAADLRLAATAQTAIAGPWMFWCRMLAGSL